MKYLLMAAMLMVPAAATAQSDSGAVVGWGGFIDGYYAYHFNLNGPADAPLFTQAVRHNEFNVNLAFVEVKLATDRVRGRFALQTGTSTSANYAGEPAVDTHSGPLLARHVQEAVVGYRIGDGLWVDGGIFLSHIGAESWISRDNWTYTRSIIAEFSPYYEAGVKATWSPSSKFSGTFAVLNGWQNISENNSNKAIGLRLDYAPTSSVTLAYSNFVGDEAPAGSGSSVRLFHDFIARFTPTDRLGLLASFDVGTQHDNVGDNDTRWYGFTTIARLQLAPTIAIAGRVERYSDPDEVFITTAVGPGVAANGVSVNVDVAPGDGFVWRTEWRSLFADTDMFQKHDGTLTRNSPFLVSSLAVTF